MPLENQISQWVDQAILATPVYELANVDTTVMTNDAFESAERDLWLKKTPVDPRFKSVLRIDLVLVGWPKVGDVLSVFGYGASGDLGSNSMKEVRRFLTQWID